eukprot:scaffold12000_cov18-Tisochrysis_lutea.AAC.1
MSRIDRMVRWWLSVGSASEWDHKSKQIKRTRKASKTLHGCALRVAALVMEGLVTVCFRRRKQEGML